MTNELSTCNYSNISFPVSHDWICRKCGLEKKMDIRPGYSVFLFELYCIKCLEKFLDESIGKLEQVIKDENS